MREHARLAPHAKLDCEVAWRAHRAALNRSNVMLHNVKELEGALVEAVDGQLGTVKDLYFDDKRWAIRYMVVETGTWLKGRKVLISPNAVHRVGWDDGVMHMSLTQQQVRDSPSIDTDKPVSRQQEAAHHNYYGYPITGTASTCGDSTHFPYRGSARRLTPRSPPTDCAMTPSPASARGASTESSNRPIRICAAATKSSVMKSWPEMARSAAWRISSSTTRAGRSATWSSIRANGFRASRCCCRRS